METAIVDKKTWNVISLLNWGTEYLEQRGFDSPRLTVELLLGRVLAYSRIELYTKFDRPLLPEDLAAFKEKFKRRLTHEPIQYILGDTEFMGLRFFVDRRVLIPRPETEILVEEVIRECRRSALKKILDIGTGSCNIAVSIAHALPDVTVDALDASADALVVAQTNIDFHNVANRVRLIQGDVLSDDFKLPAHAYDLIVSNPPYISCAEFAELEPEIRDHEPPMATTDGGDGLVFYRRLAERGKPLLRPDGVIVVEVAAGRAAVVTGIFRQEGYRNVETLPDYQNIDRVLKISHAV